MRCLRLFLVAALGASAACFHTIVDPVPSSNWTSATVGLFHTCGIFEGKAYCFGDDRTGQLGAQSSGDSTCQANGFSNPCHPKPVGVSGPRLLFVVAGRMTTCGVATDGTWCWGSGDVARRTDAPVRVTDKRFLQLATTGAQVCGLAVTSEVYCWPSSFSATPPTLTLVNQTLNFVTLTGSYAHLCALTTSGDAYCWGENAHGELAVGDTLPRAMPTHVAGSLRFISLAAGFSRTCGIAMDRHAYCSGATSWTATRQPDDAFNSITFAEVPGPDEFVDVTVGGGVACAITVLNEAKCWGNNGNMLLGTGSAGGLSAMPVSVNSDQRFRSIQAGAYHACAISTNGVMFC